MSDVPSIPQTSNDALMTAADDDRQITVHAVGDDGRLTTAVGDNDRAVVIILGGKGKISTTEKTYLAIEGTVETYCIGLENRPNYVVFDESTDTKEVAEFTFAEPEELRLQELESTGETTTEDTSDQTSESTNPRPSFGKQVVTDKNGERVTGRNPLADPSRLKEAGLHQGGN